MKRITVILLSLLLCLGLFACGNDKDANKNDADTNNNDNTATVSIDKDIDAVAKHLDLKDGTKVEYVQNMARSIMMAKWNSMNSKRIPKNTKTSSKVRGTSKPQLTKTASSSYSLRILIRNS